MKTFEVQGPSGRIYEIQGETQPSGAQLQAIIHGLQAQEKKEAALGAAGSKYTVNPGTGERIINRLGKNLKDTAAGMGSLAWDAVKSSLTPEGQVTFLPRMASNLYEGAVQYGADAIARQLPQGAEEATPGQMVKAGVAAVPVVGAYAANRATDAAEGQAPEAAADVLFDAASMMVPGTKTGRAATAGTVSAATKAAEMTGKGLAKVTKAVGPEILGTGIGTAISGGLGGGAVGAYVAHKVKQWFVERFKVSPAKAEALVEKMKPEAVVKIAKENLPPEALIPDGPIQPSAVSSSAPAGRAMVPVPEAPPAHVVSGSGIPGAVEVDPAKLTQFRPIPPNKLPPVLPDPVVPELRPALWKDGKPLNLTPEEAKAAVAAQPWNKAKAKAAEKAGETVRLYRVEAKDLGDKGEWLSKHMTPKQFETFKSERGRLFSDNPESLENYGWGQPDRNSFYVDVPKDVAEAIKRRHPDGFDEFLVPDKFVAAKKSVPIVQEAKQAVKSAIEVEERLTKQPDLVDRIGKAISPDAAWKDLRKHGAGDGKTIPSKEARAMVDEVFGNPKSPYYDPGYSSIEQSVIDRAASRNAMRTKSAPGKKHPNLKEK